MNSYFAFNPEDRPQQLAAALQEQLILPPSKTQRPTAKTPQMPDLLTLAKLLKDDKTPEEKKPTVAAGEPYSYGYM